MCSDCESARFPLSVLSCKFNPARPPLDNSSGGLWSTEKRDGLQQYSDGLSISSLSLTVRTPSVSTLFGEITHKGMPNVANCLWFPWSLRRISHPCKSYSTELCQKSIWVGDMVPWYMFLVHIIYITTVGPSKHKRSRPINRGPPSGRTTCVKRLRHRARQFGWASGFLRPKAMTIYST